MSQGFIDSALACQHHAQIIVGAGIARVANARVLQSPTHQVLVAKKGGVLGIITPDIGHPLARLLGANWLEVKRVKAHIYFFSKSTLGKMLEKANFKVRYTHTSGKYVKLESIIKELGFMHFPFAQKLLHLTQDKKWGSKSFYINPGYKMAVYAEKM